MSLTLAFPQISVVYTAKHGAHAGWQQVLQEGELGSQSMLVPCVTTCMHAYQRTVCALQADSDRAWYEGETGRRQAAQAAAESQRQVEQAQRKVLYQDLQSAAVLRQKEAQLVEHRCVSYCIFTLASAE